MNPDGRKKYEREFLLDLKHEANSMVKPDNLPDVVALTITAGGGGGNVSQNIFVTLTSR